MMSIKVLVLGKCGEKKIEVKTWGKGGCVKCLDGNGTILSYPEPSKIQVSQDIIEICNDCESISSKSLRIDEK